MKGFKSIDIIVAKWCFDICARSSWYVFCTTFICIIMWGAWCRDSDVVERSYWIIGNGNTVEENFGIFSLIWMSSWRHHRHACTHTHNHLTALCPGLPGWAGTRKVKQSGFYWSKRQFFTSRMPFLPPNQHSQSTEGNKACMQRNETCSNNILQVLSGVQTNT